MINCLHTLTWLRDIGAALQLYALICQQGWTILSVSGQKLLNNVWKKKLDGASVYVLTLILQPLVLGLYNNKPIYYKGNIDDECVWNKNISEPQVMCVLLTGLHKNKQVYIDDEWHSNFAVILKNCEAFRESLNWVNLICLGIEGRDTFITYQCDTVLHWSWFCRTWSFLKALTVI